MNSDLIFLEEKWTALTAFSKNESLKEALWKEILQRYTEKHRQYHNLYHVIELMKWLDKYSGEIKKPVVVAFAILYHDIVYNTNRHDNEEKSSELAKDHLQRLKINASVIQQVEQFILATKTHEIPADVEQKNDLAYFLDFDMAILGSDQEVYQNYSLCIWQEYEQFTDELYKAGRRNALTQMLEKPYLFYTPAFKRLMEGKARENMGKELREL